MYKILNFSLNKVLLILLVLFIGSNLKSAHAENIETILKLMENLQSDIKTLEKAVYSTDDKIVN